MIRSDVKRKEKKKKGGEGDRQDFYTLTPTIIPILWDNPIRRNIIAALPSESMDMD